VFDRFFRVPGGPPAAGAGLGLAIAKEIVEAHGGSISVRSTVGQGTRFEVALRRAPDPQPQQATRATATAEVTA
jgi:signal transduction histidine kinase